MERFEVALRDMVKGLSAADKESLRVLGLGILLVLKQVNTEPLLMEECLKAWDSEYHVFRFPLGEVCSFPEEFAAVGGLP